MEQDDIYITPTPEVEAYNEKLIAAYTARHGFLPAIFDYDDEGRIIEYGTDRDYDTHAVDVQNGYGYYDDDGWYHGYRHNYYTDDGEYVD